MVNRGWSSQWGSGRYNEWGAEGERHPFINYIYLQMESNLIGELFECVRIWRYGQIKEYVKNIITVFLKNIFF